jgi:circadian clock protein KaiC
MGATGPRPAEGLDDILGGGFILGRLNLVEGKTGTCKTTLGMQFVLAGRDRDEKGWGGVPPRC